MSNDLFNIQGKKALVTGCRRGIGKAIAIGFGKTPISVENEIRLADKCNVWGTTSFDLKKLKDVVLGCEVLVEKYE